MVDQNIPASDVTRDVTVHSQMGSPISPDVNGTGLHEGESETDSDSVSSTNNLEATDNIPDTKLKL